jgi:hypothetical protein
MTTYLGSDFDALPTALPAATGLYEWRALNGDGYNIQAPFRINEVFCASRWWHFHLADFYLLLDS